MRRPRDAAACRNPLRGNLDYAFKSGLVGPKFSMLTLCFHRPHSSQSILFTFQLAMLSLPHLDLPDPFVFEMKNRLNQHRPHRQIYT